MSKDKGLGGLAGLEVGVHDTGADGGEHEGDNKEDDYKFGVGVDCHRGATAKFSVLASFKTMRERDVSIKWGSECA